MVEKEIEGLQEEMEVRELDLVDLYLGIESIYGSASPAMSYNMPHPIRTGALKWNRAVSIQPGERYSASSTEAVFLKAML